MSDATNIIRRGGIAGRRPGAERLPDSDAEVLDEFWRPADAPAPGPWIARDGLACVGCALGVSLARAAELVAARLRVSPRRPLRWIHCGFEASGLGFMFGEAVEDLEGAALRRRVELASFSCERGLCERKDGKVELSGG